MKFLNELLTNKILVISATSWLIAGVIKVIVEFIVNKKLDFKRVVGAGGMPSSHTATVVSLCISIGFISKIDSPLFALSFMFMIIVIHDAIGVRLETGKQAKVLNTMLGEGVGDELGISYKLKEYVGHTPRQAFFGALIGLIVSLIMLKYYSII